MPIVAIAIDCCYLGLSLSLFRSRASSSQRACGYPPVHSGPRVQSVSLLSLCALFAFSLCSLLHSLALSLRSLFLLSLSLSLAHSLADLSDLRCRIRAPLALAEPASICKPCLTRQDSGSARMFFSTLCLKRGDVLSQVARPTKPQPLHGTRQCSAQHTA